jgi:hypothetical protein
MDQYLQELDSRSISLWFTGFYLVVWFYFSNDFLWLVVSSLACVFFIRFTLALPAGEQAALPPISIVISVFHWLAAYMYLFSNAK